MEVAASNCSAIKCKSAIIFQLEFIIRCHEYSSLEMFIDFIATFVPVVILDAWIVYLNSSYYGYKYDRFIERFLRFCIDLDCSVFINCEFNGMLSFPTGVIVRSPIDDIRKDLKECVRCVRKIADDLHTRVNDSVVSTSSTIDASVANADSAFVVYQHDKLDTGNSLVSDDSSSVQQVDVCPSCDVDSNPSTSEIDYSTSFASSNCIAAPIASNTIDIDVHTDEPLCDIVVCDVLSIAPVAAVDNHASTLSNSSLSESEIISATRTLSSELVDPAEAHPLRDMVAVSAVVPEQLICSTTLDYVVLIANCFHFCIFQLHLIENLEINCVIVQLTDRREIATGNLCPYTYKRKGVYTPMLMSEPDG